MKRSLISAITRVWNLLFFPISARVHVSQRLCLDTCSEHSLKLQENYTAVILSNCRQELFFNKSNNKLIQTIRFKFGCIHFIPRVLNQFVVLYTYTVYWFFDRAKYQPKKLPISRKEHLSRFEEIRSEVASRSSLRRLSQRASSFPSSPTPCFPLSPLFPLTQFHSTPLPSLSFFLCFFTYLFLSSFSVYPSLLLIPPSISPFRWWIILLLSSEEDTIPYLPSFHQEKKSKRERKGDERDIKEKNWGEKELL